MPRRREGPRKDKKLGIYYFDEIVGFGKERKRIRYSLRTKDPDKAQMLWEQQFRKEWRHYYGIESKEAPRPIAFVEIAKEFLAYEKDIKRIKEWRVVKSRLNIIDEIWGDVNLHEISSKRLTQLDSRLKEMGRSLNTINHYFALLKTLFYFAIKKKRYQGENPISEVKPYIVNGKRREYSPEEIARILEAAERIEKEARAGALLQKYAKRIVLLLLYTGMRLGEVLNLRWENIQNDKIVLKRTETKQQKEKIIPIASGIQGILEGLKDGRRKDGFVFPFRRRGGVMKPGYADNVIRKIREYSGIPDFIFHNLRHTASTIMVSEALGKGVSLADVMKVLGHSQVGTTMKYIHEDFERMKRAVEILESQIKK